MITPADLIWSTLRIWTDGNADGRSQPGELRRPALHRFLSFEVYPKFKPHYDEAGNYIPLYAWATQIPNKKNILVDVFFKSLP